MRKFADGGFTKEQEEWLGGADRTDPYILARMREAIPDKKVKESVVEETSADLDPYGAASKKPAAVEKTVVKTKVTPSSKSKDIDTVETEPVSPKKSSVKELKEVIGVSSMPKSFRESGGNLTAKKSSASMPSMRMSLPDPLANFDSKGKRLQSRDYDYKKGGSVSSASKRADGCAIRGKTKGKIC